MRAIASQKLPRDSGESISAARHQDVSQDLWEFFVDVSNICPTHQEEGGSFFLLKMPRGQGLPGEGRGGRRAGRCLRGLGRGAKYFFSGPKFPPRIPAFLQNRVKPIETD